MGDGIPDVFQSSTSLISSSSVVQVGTLPIILDQWRSIASNRFMLNMVKGHNHQLRAWPLLFCNFTGSTLRLLLFFFLLSKGRYRNF